MYIKYFLYGNETKVITNAVEVYHSPYKKRKKSSKSISLVMSFLLEDIGLVKATI